MRYLEGRPVRRPVPGPIESTRIGQKRYSGKRVKFLAAALLAFSTLGVVTSADAQAQTTADSKPVANIDNYSFKGENNLSVSAPGVLANDTDPNNQKMIAQLVTEPQFGVLTAFYSNGSFTYMPYPNPPAYDSFSYRVWDGAQYSDPTTVNIQSLPSNTAPSPQPDDYNWFENTPLTVSAPGLLSNDSDPDGDAITLSSIQSQPTYGTLSAIAADGSFTYIPKWGFVGIDHFTYAISDGKVNSAPATVTIHIMPDPAIPHNDAYTVAQDHPLDVGSPGLLGNDVDPNGYPMTVQDITQWPSHGALLWYFTTGGFHYVPNAGFSGTDTFRYNVMSDNQKSGSATVTITVIKNHRPVAHNDSYPVHKNGSLTVKAPGLLKNDTDADKDKLTVAAYLTAPSHGSLSHQKADGSFIYTPKKGFVGVDHFTYRLSGSHPAGTATGTVILTVR